MGVERELKVMADGDREVPDLADAVAGLRLGAVARAALVATYYDTDDLRLARAGVTLRSRRGEPGPAWTLKLPLGDEHGDLARREITFRGPATKLPAEAADAVLAYRRGAALQKVAVLRTDRSSTEVFIGDERVATLCDDRVDAESSGEAMTFRELEVELVDPDGVDDAGVLKAIRSRLRASGWETEGDALPKVVRVLGERAVAPPDVAVPKLRRRARAADAVRVALSRSVLEIISFDAGTRRGVEPEDLHCFRVATRRLRSDLRTFRPLVDPSWSTSLREELRWLGEEVGAVRDLDVLRERLRVRIARVAEPEGADALELLAMLDAQRDAARAEMLAAMRSDRYVALLDALVDAAREPKLVDDETITRRDAARAFPALVRKPWKRLRAAANEITERSTDEELHEVRILAKRCRYAADAASLVCGRDARRFAAAMKSVQSVLGDHQDTVITEAWLRRAAAEKPSVGLLAGLLIADELDERSHLRHAAVEVWADAQRPALRRWFD